MTIEGGENQIAWGMESARKEMMENLWGGGGCKCGFNKDLCFNTGSFNSWPPPATPNRNRRLGGGGSYKKAENENLPKRSWLRWNEVSGGNKNSIIIHKLSNTELLGFWLFFPNPSLRQTRVPWFQSRAIKCHHPTYVSIQQDLMQLSTKARWGESSVLSADAP